MTTGRCNLTVHAGTSTSYVLSLLTGSADWFGEPQRTELQRLIRRDHDFHAKSAKSAKSTGSARSARSTGNARNRRR